MFIASSSSSSSSRAISTDIPYPLPPPYSIVHRFRQVLKVISCTSTEVLYVGLAGPPAFTRLCEGVHRSKSLMCSSLLLQQCPACLVHLTLTVFVMGGKWPYSCCFGGCCLLDLFNIACSILICFPSSFFFIRLVSVHIVHPYSSIDTTTAWKKNYVLFYRSGLTSI